jgi:hypothetical protein
MNQKQAISRMKRESRAVRVIQPAWWVDEAVAIEIRTTSATVQNESASCNIAVDRETKRACTQKFPGHRTVLRKEFVC